MKYFMVFYRQSTGISGGVTYFPRYNGFGDVTALLDTSGNIVVRYAYDAWGKVLSVTDAGGNAITDKYHVGTQNPFRYRGYYYDTETGFYYLQSRYYDPETGRFINADSIAGVRGQVTSNNVFAYCFNNPILFIDTTGNWPQWLKNIGNAVGSFFNKAGQVVATFINSIHSEIGAGVGIGASAKASVATIPAEVSAIAKVDAFSWKSGKGQQKFGTSYKAAAGAGLGPASLETGTSKFHSYTGNSDRCNCDWTKPIVEIAQCPDAEFEPLSSDLSLGFGVEAYLGVGFTMKAEFNLTYFTEEIVKIFQEE